jgi:8-oxo-dGTP pyrophosphatase MutT (NUDIX family)
MPPADNGRERLLNAPKYKAWKRIVEGNGCVVGDVDVLSAVSKRDGSLLFAFIKADVRDPGGRPLPAYALIRGHAVVVVTEVVNRDTGDRLFLMIRQRRIGSGAETLEFPAGMVDESVDEPHAVALKELEEETGLIARPDQVFPLCHRPLYSSSGLNDEAIHFYGCSLELPGDRFHALEASETGKADEGEFIRLCLIGHDEALPLVDSVQVRLGFSLWYDRNTAP